MEGLFILGLTAACGYLFHRLGNAEQRLHDIEARLADTEWRVANRYTGPHVDEQAAASPVDAEVEAAEPATAAKDVSGVRLVSAAEPIGHDDAPDPDHSAAQPPAIVADSVPIHRRALNLDFEEIFGRRLPIWAGGITLAVAGVFLVRFSIEAGLLTPLVRVILSFLFGAGLLVAAELAYRFAERVADERVRQALAGAGLATLYAAFYLAGTQYALIGQTVAFLGLAAVTALAIYLSYRFGLPSAVLGLVGGFAAPALVGGEDANLPMLALYLALVTGGLTQTANRQKRSWLGLGALAGGLGWGALMLLGGGFDTGDIAATGLYLVVLGALVPAFLDIDKLQQPVRIASAGLAGVQLAVLVDTAGYAPLAWALYLLLGAALAWFGWTKAAMRAGSAMAAAIGIVLLALWPSPDPTLFTIIAASLTVLFAGVPLMLLQGNKGLSLEALTVAGVTVAIGIVAVAQFETFAGDTVHVMPALAYLALAVLPGMAARILWDRTAQGELAANMASAALLIFFAAVAVLPDDFNVVAASAISASLVLLLRRGQAGAPGTKVAWAAAISTAAVLTMGQQWWGEVEALYNGLRSASLLAFVRWFAVAGPFAALALTHFESQARRIAEFLAGLFLFAALAQILPPVWLVWTAFAFVAAVRFAAPGHGFAGLALTACIAMWALVPIGDWLTEAMGALVGNPILVTYLPDLRALIGFVLPLALALGLAQLPLIRYFKRPLPLFWLGIPVALIVVHALYKLVFHLDSLPDFERLGVAERTVWQALLLGAAWSVWVWRKDRWIASVLALAALAHFAWFTLALHNPLWSHQAVGHVPVANLALAAYGIGIGALLSLRHWWPEWRRGADVAIMGLALIGALTLLRQVFAGTYLDTLPITQTEDLLRSLIGILLAVAFLLIGSARGERLWRLGSLVLMTGTVLKVFIVDTAGLEGLLRIASFVALGASLIGIGWFYSRQLKGAPPLEIA